MKKNKVNILSTRPVGKTLIDYAAKYDIIIDEGSFIRTEEIKDRGVVEKIQNLSQQNVIAVFTSMNAVEAVRKFLPLNPSWKIFCIGHTTKKLAENIFGEENILGVADSAGQLAENIIEHSKIKKVYFFCGDQRRDELPEKLKINKMEIEELMVYKTINTPQVISKNYDGILFFSPSAVKSFFLRNSIPHNSQIFAIGDTTAQAVKPFSPQPVIVAEIPGKENLVAQVINYFNRAQIS